MIELPRDGIYRIRFPDGKYAAGYYKKTKRGKTWNGASHLHQHLAQYYYNLEQADKIGLYGADGTASYFHGSVIVNERTGEEFDAYAYLLQRFEIAKETKAKKKQAHLKRRGMWP